MQSASGKVPGAFHVCSLQNGQRLAVDGKAAKAEQKRGKREIGRRRGQTGHSGDASAEFQQSGQERPAEAKLPARGGGEGPGGGGVYHQYER